MIASLKINDPANCPVEWWDKVESLEGMTEFTFDRERPTILWGPNGSGKSTVLRLLAYLTHSSQSGGSHLTRASCQAISDPVRYASIRTGDDPDVNAAVMSADKQKVFYMNPADSPGMIGGMAGFDDDFFSLGLEQVQTANRLSEGQRTMYHMHRMSEGERGDLTIPVKSDLTFAAKHTATVKAVLDKHKRETKCKKGKVTFLLDEPTRSMDLPLAIKFWNNAHRLAQRVQIIMATHHPFALGFIERSNANVIELKQGYLEECKQLVEAWRTA